MERPEISSKDAGMCPHKNFPATCPICKESREKSWQSVEAFIARLEKTASPETMKSVEKLEPKDGKEAVEMAKEELSVMKKAEEFDPEESVSVPTQALNLRKRITNSYMRRDEKGKGVAIVDGINIVIPRTEDQPDKLMFTTWYVARDKNFKGDAGVKEMYVQALKDFLTEAKAKNMEVLGIAGETEEDVQILFNRFGTNRMYMKTKDGVEEVGYVAPPEDESSAGVPEHFMIYLADGRHEMSTQEVTHITKAVHAQYTRDDFFTQKHLQAEAANLEMNPKDVTPEFARKYHDNYRKIASGATAQVEQSLQRSVDGKVMLLSAREIKALKKEGTKVTEIQDEE